MTDFFGLPPPALVVCLFGIQQPCPIGPTPTFPTSPWAVEQVPPFSLVTPRCSNPIVLFLISCLPFFIIAIFFPWRPASPRSPSRTFLNNCFSPFPTPPDFDFLFFFFSFSPPVSRVFIKPPFPPPTFLLSLGVPWVPVAPAYPNFFSF